MPSDPTSSTKLTLPLSCWHESLASARTDSLVEISVDGAFIRTDRPVPVGTPLFLEVTLPLDDTATHKAEIDAVAVAKNGNDDEGFAVRFLALDERTRTWIEKRVAASKRTATPAARVASVEPPAIGATEAPTAVDKPSTKVTPASPQPRSFEAMPDTKPGADVDDLPWSERVDKSERFIKPERSETKPMFSVPPDDTVPLPPAPPPSLDETAPFTKATGPKPGAARRDEFEIPPHTPAPIAIDETQPWAKAAPAKPPVIDVPRLDVAATPAATPAPTTATLDEAPLLSEALEDIDVVDEPPAPAQPAEPTPAPSEKTSDAPPLFASASARSPFDSLPPSPFASLSAKSGTPLPSNPFATGASFPPSPVERASSMPDTTAPFASGPVPLPPHRTPTFGGSQGASPSAPMPKIASLDVPGGAPLPAIEETQRWPTAKVRVAQAPLELPVSDVPFAPPDVDDEAKVAGGLESVFPGESNPPLRAAALQNAATGSIPPIPASLVKPDVAKPSEPSIVVDPHTELAPESAKGASVELEAPPSLSFHPGPTSAPTSDANLFGQAGGMLSDDDEIPVGGQGLEAFGIEVTDPGSKSPAIEAAVPATLEDAPVRSFDEPAPADTAEADEIEMVEVEALDDFKDVIGAPTPAVQLSGEGEPVMPAPEPSTPKRASTPPMTSAPDLPRETAASPMPEERPRMSTQTEPYLSLKGLRDLQFPTAPSSAPTTNALPPLGPPPSSTTPAFNPFAPKPSSPQPSVTEELPLSAMEPLPLPESAMEPLPSPPAALSGTKPTTDPFLAVWPGSQPITTPPPIRAPITSPITTPPPIVPAVAAASMLGNTSSPTTPPQSSETWFDDLAFQAAEGAAPGSPLDPAAWQVPQPAKPGAPSSSPAPSTAPAKPAVDPFAQLNEPVEDDLPVVVGRTSIDTPPPLWIVGEPAKK